MACCKLGDMATFCSTFYHISNKNMASHRTAFTCLSESCPLRHSDSEEGTKNPKNKRKNNKKCEIFLRITDPSNEELFLGKVDQTSLSEDLEVKVCALGGKAKNITLYLSCEPEQIQIGDLLVPMIQEWMKEADGPETFVVKVSNLRYADRKTSKAKVRNARAQLEAIMCLCSDKVRLESMAPADWQLLLQHVSCSEEEQSQALQLAARSKLDEHIDKVFTDWFIEYFAKECKNNEA